MPKISYIVQKSLTGGGFDIVRRSPYMKLDTGIIYSSSVDSTYNTQELAKIACDYKNIGNDV